MSPSEQLENIKRTIRLEWEWELYVTGKIKDVSDELAAYYFNKRLEWMVLREKRKGRYTMNSTTQLAYWDSKKNGYYSIGENDK